MDKFELEVRKLEPSKKFDDPHLVAIVLVSECRIICTADKRAAPYLKSTRFYPRKTKRPKIYGSRRNKSLLIEKYVADIRLPCDRLTKEAMARLILA